MNDEKLIELVRNNPVFYDPANPKYMDADYKNALWGKIGEEIKTDGPSCKIRWGNIRDNFRKSLNKQRTKSGQKAKNVKRYKYSEQLSFLIKFFEGKQTRSNTDDDNGSGEPATPSNQEHTEDCTTDFVTVESHSQISSKTKPTGSVEHSIPRKKTKQSVPNDTPPKTAATTVMDYNVKRNENMASLSPPQHPVDAFLVAIAPDLKKLPPLEWHYAKAEIFATVQKYELRVLTNQQQFVEPPISTCSTPTYGYASSAGHSTSGSGDDHQSRSCTDQN